MQWISCRPSRVASGCHETQRSRINNFSSHFSSVLLHTNMKMPCLVDRDNGSCLCKFCKEQTKNYSQNANIIIITAQNTDRDLIALDCGLLTFYPPITLWANSTTVLKNLQSELFTVCRYFFFWDRRVSEFKSSVDLKSWMC